MNTTNCLFMIWNINNIECMSLSDETVVWDKYALRSMFNKCRGPIHLWLFHSPKKQMQCSLELYLDHVLGGVSRAKHLKNRDGKWDMVTCSWWWNSLQKVATDCICVSLYCLPFSKENKGNWPDQRDAGYMWEWPQQLLLIMIGLQGSSSSKYKYSWASD